MASPSGGNPHFLSVASRSEASELVTFQPRWPRLPGLGEPSIAIHVRDHRRRELPAGSRSLEAHYDGFVLSQARRGADEAARLALRVPYGRDARTVWVSGHEGRAYPLGPEVPPDDVDGRAPAVVTWHEGGVHFLMASGTLEVERLEAIAASLYPEEQVPG